jgi:ectoine hydroxylase-related dioxygenase (phytanoyl-CoA dioxygenase family)
MQTTESFKIPQFKKDPEAAFAFYKEHGFQIELDVWSAAEMAAIKQAARKLPDFLNGSYIPTLNPHRLEDTFLKALCKKKLVEIMRRMVHGKVSGLQTQYFFGKPGTKGFAMHQDNFYVESKQDAFASAWNPFVDISPKVGGLIVYPGSHLEPILPVDKFEEQQTAGQDKNARREQVRLPEKYQPVSVVTPAGSVVFIHGHNVHSSHDNQTDIYREVLLCTYLRAGEKFRPGFSAKRNEVDVEAALVDSLV